MNATVSPAPVVVDASAVVALLKEADPVIATAWRGWDEAWRMVLAPPWIWLETANALLRGHRLPGARVLATLDALEATGLEIADRGPDGVRQALQLAERHQLTVYDAAYLWLAIDVDGELATRDAELIRAAEAEGVPLALG